MARVSHPDACPLCIEWIAPARSRLGTVVRVRGGPVALRGRDQVRRAWPPEISLLPDLQRREPAFNDARSASAAALRAAIAGTVSCALHAFAGRGRAVHVVHITPLRPLGPSHTLIRETEQYWTNRTV